MTLVVAGMFADGPRLVGDTRLTASRTGTSSPLLEGALKVVILHPNLVIGFAGDAGAAADWIAALEMRPDAPFSMEAVLSSARKATTAADMHLLMARYRPGRLVHVAKGMVTERDDTWAWVGEREAFSAFQSGFAAARRDLNAESSRYGSASEGGAMVQGLQSVVDSHDHPSVGGFVLASFPFAGGFGYSCSFRASAGGSQTIPSGVATTLQFGQGAAAGSYSEAILTPAEPGLGVIGVHLREISRGVLFWPARFRQPIDYFDCDQTEFVDRVQADHGIVISGPVLS